MTAHSLEPEHTEMSEAAEIAKLKNQVAKLQGQLAKQKPKLAKQTTSPMTDAVLELRQQVTLLQVKLRNLRIRRVQSQRVT